MAQDGLDQSLVDKLKVMMKGIFQRYCVVSDSAQEACIRNIIRNGNILELARQKYDMAAHLDHVSALNVFASGTAIVQKQRYINVGVSMSPADRALVVAHNPDYKIDFDNNQRINHSIAYVQRIIETKRCLSTLRHDQGYITDIGGNPYYHAKAGHDTVHSCVLVDNTRDLSRMALRNLSAEFGDVAHKLRYCQHGVQACMVDSSEAMSIFAVQDIDPVDLVFGLYKKGVEYCTGVFHYDPIMFEAESGYFPYFRMHFFRETSSSGTPQFVFHFDNDSSFDYRHDVGRLLKYSRSWSYAVPNTEYVYRYDLVYVKDGIARFTVVRQNREYLGAANNEVAYRYVNHDDFYRINSWTIDFDSTTNSAFTGFKPLSMDVSKDLFMFLYKYGLSNDTDNPDKLFTVDQLRAQARTFNETRTLNGYAFTGRVTISPMELEQLVVAMYVIVNYDLAVESAIANAQVGTMVALQSDRLDKRFFSTTGKIVAFSFALPLLFAGAKVRDFFLYVNTVMRTAATVGDMGVSWKVVPSFTQLDDMHRVSGDGRPQVLQLTGHSFDVIDRTETFIQPSQIRELFDDVLTEEQKAMLDRTLSSPYVLDKDLPEVSEGDSIASARLSPIVNEFDIAADGSMDWYSESIEDYLQVKRGVEWKKDSDHEEVSEEVLSKHSLPAVKEHALYCFDTAISQVKAAKDKCSEVFYGVPNGNAIEKYNNTEDAGIQFLRVNQGDIVLDKSSIVKYSFGIDPNTGQHHEIKSGPNGFFILNKFTTLLFVSKNTQILNGFSLGKRLLALYNEQNSVHTAFRLVDAIYGAGKTHEIIQRFEFADVIVTQTSASREDILARLQKDPRLKGHDLSKWIRTADSAVMHGLPRAATVFIDEGLMMFPGQIFAICMMTKSEIAYVYGDTAQIPPIDRSATLGFLTYQGMCRWNSIEFRNVTYRSPKDVVLVLADYFKIERRALLKTANPIRHSLSLEIVSKVSDNDHVFAPNPYYTYITILQVDKGSLLVNPNMKDGKKYKQSELQEGQARLLNVGEAQGSTFPHVCIARKFPYGDNLFAQIPQTVVAFSRHTKSCVYKTTVPSDPYVKLIQRAMHFSDAQLDAVGIPTPDWLQSNLDNSK